MGLVQAALSGLDHRDAVLRVADRLVQALDLATQLLADREASRVIRRLVDAESAGQPLDALRKANTDAVQVALGVDRVDVRVNPHSPIPPCRATASMRASPSLGPPSSAPGFSWTPEWGMMPRG